MDISIISVFPEYFDSMQLSLLGKAQASGIVRIQVFDLRDWAHDVHRSVDDTPAGGGAGMVMKPEVWAECLDDVLGTSGAPAGLSSHPELSDSAAVSTASGSASACASAGPSSPGLAGPRRAFLARLRRIGFLLFRRCSGHADLSEPLGTAVYAERC